MKKTVVIAGRKVPVSAWMSAPVITVGATASLEEAADLIRERSIGCLPVVVGGLIVGVVTRGDLWRAGLRREQLGTHLCAACRTHRHVRPDRNMEDVTFCLECRERSRPNEHDDLGEGD